MKTQKSTVFSILFAILAVFCLFTACEEPSDPPPQTAEKPSATPAGGNYASAQTVTLTSATTGADIYYTLDGTTPTTDSAQYSSPITISETKTLKAVAVKTGWTDSEILTETYTITPPGQVVKPSAAPAGGNYTTVQTVTLTTATTGADIHYTLDGTAPTASSAKYSSPITISTTTTLKAIAIKASMTDSDILTETYTITTPGKVVQPTATPAGGNYTSAQTVTLTSATTGADIHYTLDGTAPMASSAKYSSPITISTTTTLKAIAVKADMTDSDILSETYTITTPMPTNFTVTYDAGGGTPAPASSFTVNPGGTVAQPSAMTKNWHTFGGWYTDSARTVPASFPITVTSNVNLYAKWIVNTLISIAEVSSYLASLPSNTSDSPASLPVNINLGTMTATNSGWQQLLDAISTPGKYVNLDLSLCTMNGTSFNPDSSVATGKDKIVSLVLPPVAMSIEAGVLLGDSTFKNFTNLTSVSGGNIITIGANAFYSSSSTTGNKRLQSVDFPHATNIDNYAFAYCTSLQSISLPQATSIDYGAFSGCTSLQSVSFPASVTLSTVNPTFAGCTSLTSFTLSGTGSLSVIENGRALVRDGTVLIAYPTASGTITMNTITSIFNSAFRGCTGLQSVSFSQVTSIDSNAFDGCTALQGVSFPLATSVGSSAFTGCRGLQSANFPQITAIGNQAFWSCTGLQSLNIPKVTSIGSNAFSYTGTATLTITMGSAAPTLSYSMFNYVTSAKTVMVKIPSGATGYTPFTGSAVTVSGTNTTANWANGLRGGGWTGSTWDPSYGSDGPSSINQNISLIIEGQ